MSYIKRHESTCDEIEPSYAENISPLFENLQRLSRRWITRDLRELFKVGLRPGATAQEDPPSTLVGNRPLASFQKLFSGFRWGSAFLVFGLIALAGPLSAADDSGEFEIVQSGPESVVIEGYLGDSTDLIIPQTLMVGGSPLNVKAIGPAAFSNNNAIQSISFEDGVEVIFEEAFESMNSLESVSLPATLVAIHQGAFRVNWNLKSVTFPENLDGAATIGSYAFEFADIQSIRIPQQVTEIGDSAFRYSALESIEIENELIDIGAFAFANLDNLESVTLTLTTFATPGGGIFFQSSIGSAAFASNPNLRTVYFDKQEPGSFGNNVFSGAHPSFVVMFPGGSPQLEQSTWNGYPVLGAPENWGAFGIVQQTGPDRHRSAVYGELVFFDGGASQTEAFSLSLVAPLSAQNGQIHSPHYGNLTPNPWDVPDWVVSQFFGLVHFGSDAAQYDGWVNSERFDWMKFEDGYLWVHHLQTWLAVNPDGSFHSFDFGWMVPQAGSWTRYNTRIGMVTTDSANPQGWLASDNFGFVWFARDGTGVWFWSTNRNEWIGITEGGGLWSTAEGRFLE